MPIAIGVALKSLTRPGQNGFEMTLQLRCWMLLHNWSSCLIDTVQVGSGWGVFFWSCPLLRGILIKMSPFDNSVSLTHGLCWFLVCFCFFKGTPCGRLPQSDLVWPLRGQFFINSINFFKKVVFAKQSCAKTINAAGYPHIKAADLSRQNGGNCYFYYTFLFSPKLYST